MTYPIENFTLIFGAMKCGTTSLFNYLAEHPQIAPCKVKEPNFFTHEKSWNKGLDYYRTLWDYDPAVHTTAMEASVNYSKIPRLPNAAERIAKTALESGVNFKLIYIIRNPIDRVISHCTHDLEEQWSVRYNHPMVHGIPYPAIEISKYAMQINEYYQRFPSQNVLLLNADNLKHNPNQVLKQVCEFLEVDADFAFPNLSKQHNSSKGKPITNKAWPMIDKYLASPVISYLPSSMRGRTMRTVRSWFSTGKVHQKFELSEDQRQFILDELRSDICELSSKYDVDISQWNLIE